MKNTNNDGDVRAVFEFLAGTGAAAGLNAEVVARGAAMRSLKKLSPTRADLVPAVFAERLRMLRARAKLTQAQVAQYVGVSRATVSAWENAKVKK